MNLKVIEMNGGGKFPSGPFLTYDFPLGFDPQGFPAYEQLDNIKRQIGTVNFTVSFLSYAADKADSVENALRVQDWFKGEGRLQLKENANVVVISVGQIENRDINIGVQWERRQGFDVEFRTVDVTDTETGYIESANIEGVERSGTT